MQLVIEELKIKTEVLGYFEVRFATNLHGAVNLFEATLTISKVFSLSAIHMKNNILQKGSAKDIDSL